MHQTHASQYAKTAHKQWIYTVDPPLLWLQKLEFYLKLWSTDTFVDWFSFLTQVNIILDFQEATSYQVLNIALYYVEPTFKLSKFALYSIGCISTKELIVVNILSSQILHFDFTTSFVGAHLKATRSIWDSSWSIQIELSATTEWLITKIKILRLVQVWFLHTAGATLVLYQG